MKAPRWSGDAVMNAAVIVPTFMKINEVTQTPQRYTMQGDSWCVSGTLAIKRNILGLRRRKEEKLAAHQFPTNR